MPLRNIVGRVVLISGCFLSAQAATVTWDGGGGNSFFTTANNWSGDVAPADTDDVVVDANTNLRGAGNWILDIDGGAAKSLTLDPTWTGGQIGMRGDAALDIANNGAITITSNYTDNSSATFGNSLGGNLTLRSIVNNGTLNFVNNSAKEVSFVGGSGGNVVQLRGRTGNETTAFGGTGDFLLGTDVTLLILERIWTDAAFGGTLTLNGDAGFMNPSTDLRINGGTLKIGANEQIEDTTTLAFGTASGITGILDAVGITETAGTVNNFSDANATLSILVDSSTALTFANFNDGGQDRGDIDITGWVEGSSSIVFSSLSSYDWTVGEMEAFVGLTIGGAPAYMTDSGGSWALTSISAPAFSQNGNVVLTPFSTDNATASASQSFQVVGSNLVGNVTVASDSTDFEVSADDSTWTNSLALAQSGGSVSTSVYVRVIAGATSGTLNETLTLSTSGAANQTVNLSATVYPAGFVFWDGGAGNSQWGLATNWNNDAGTTLTDDVIVNVQTNLRAGFVLDVITTEAFSTLTLDPTWTGTADPNDDHFIGIRGNGILDAYGSMTFTTNYTQNPSTTISANTSGSLAMRARGNVSIVNNGSAAVSIVGIAADKVVNFGGTTGTEQWNFGGTGDFLIGDHVEVFANLERLWTEETFSGTLTLTNTAQANWMAPGTDVRIEGGTLKIAADEQIGDATQIGFGGSSAGLVLDARGITETAGILTDYTSAGADSTIRVDGSTALTFSNYRPGASAQGINVTGWSEGSSSFTFSALTTQFYGGTIAAGAAVVGITIDGSTAYLTDIGGVGGTDWGLTITPVWTISGTESLSGDNQIADYTVTVMTNGTLNLAGYSDTIGTLEISDDSTLILNGGSIEFADSSTITWNGWLDIVGELGATSVRFGTDANGLTAAQLGWIRHGGATVYLDANGYLQRVGEVTTHSYVGGTNDFGYTQVLEDFDWGTTPSAALSGGVSSLTSGADGTGSFAIDAAASDPAIDFINSPYTFEPDAYPYMRINYRSSATDTLTFWPSPNNPINKNNTATIAAPEFKEYGGRFLSLALTDPADASVVDPWNSNGLRIDPLTIGTGSIESFELDYVMVDSFATLGLGEFNREPNQWTRNNVSGVITDLDKLTGTAGSSATNRSISLSLALTNSLYNAVEIRVMRESGSTGPMRLRWYAQDIGWFNAEWQPESDGQYYSYMIDLGGCMEWRDNVSTEIQIELFDDSVANNGKAYGVDFIRLRNLPELGAGIIHEEVNWGAMLAVRYEPDYDYVLSKLRYFRSAAGQCENAGWSGNVPASAKRNQFEVSIDGRQPWWKEAPVDSDGDGTNDFEWVTRDTNGVPSVEASAEAFFQEIKTIAELMRNTNTPDDAKYLYSIFPDNALSEIMFPNSNENIGGGFYEVVYRKYEGGDFDETNTLTSNDYVAAYIPEAQAMAADCFVTMMQKLKADPVTRDVKMYCFNALHVWGWNEAVPEREHSNNESDPGYLEDMLDTLLATNAVAFPNGDSPLAGFAQDFPEQYYLAFHHSRKKLNEYMDYAQSRGYPYAVTCNGEHSGITIDTPRSGYEAIWRYMRRMILNGARPDEVHAYVWQTPFDGDYETTLLTEHEDADYTYMAALRRTHDQIAYNLPPARPATPAAAYTNNGVVISWEANQEYDLYGYDVQRAASAEGSFTTLATQTAGTSYTDTTASTNAVYYYRTIAVLEDSVTFEQISGLPSEIVRVGASAPIVLMQDNFDNQSNPGWYSHLSTPSVVADNDDDNDGVAAGDYALKIDYPATGGFNWLRYFRDAGSAVNLYEGDRLKVEWQAKQTGFNSSGATYLRFGLADSHGSRITTDTAYTSPVFTNSTGYMVAFADLTDTVFPYAHATIQRRDAPDESLSETAAYSGIQGMFDMMGMAIDEWTPMQSITMERKSDGWLVETVLGGYVTSGGTTGAVTTVQRLVEADATTSFDTFWLRYVGGDVTLDALLDNVTVTLERVPGRLLPEDYASSTTVNVPFGSTLDLVAGSAAIGGLSGAGHVDLSGGSLTVGSNNANTSYSGTFSGSGNLVKTGSGTLTLSGGTVGTIGALQLSEGTLALSGGPYAFADSSNLSWSGSLTISGTLGPDTLRFGTDSTGLTADQLAQISHNGYALELNDEGYLQHTSPYGSSGLSATHYSWTRSAAGTDSEWTKLVQPFNSSTLDSTVTTGNAIIFSDSTDGSYQIEVNKNKAGFDCTMQGSTYGFNPADYPYIRFRMKSPEANTLTYGALNDWEHATLATASNTLSYTVMSSFEEVSGRFANVPTHIQQGDRYTDDGFRFDLVTNQKTSDRFFDMDYIAVDSHPVLAIDEFDMTSLDGGWIVSNLSSMAVSGSVVTGLVSGAAGNDRLLSKTVSVDGEYWNMLELRLAREAGAVHGFAFWWKDASNDWHNVELTPSADDGEFYYYLLDLAKCPEWSAREVTGLRFDPYSSDEANNGLGFKIDYLRLRHMPVTAGSSMEWALNLKAETHVHRWNTGNALMQYIGTSLAIWNSPGGDNDYRSGYARLARERGLRLNCTIQSAKFFEGPADYDTDGKTEYRIPQVGGQPDPQLCAELAFAHIRQLGEDMQAVGFDEVYIGFDGLMRYLLFPTYRLDQDDTSGGFYEASGNQIDQEAWDNCADTLIRLMQMCHTNQYTTNFRFRVYPNFHMWEWEGMPRDLTRDIVSVGDFMPVVDAIHAANTAAFPDGDSPLIIFDADYSEDFVKWGNKCRKLVRYQDYIQDLGYLAMCNAINAGTGITGGLDDRIASHASTTNFIGMVTRYGGRPDIINCGWWQDNWAGSFFSAAVDEEDIEEYNLTSLWTKLMNLITADTGSRFFNESLPEFTAAGASNELYKVSGVSGSAYSGSLAGDAEDADVNDTLVFSKLSGPDWLTVAADGSLSGTPAGSDGGTNTFLVRVSDGRGGIDDISLYIEVQYTVPDVPMNLTATVASFDQIDLSWSAVLGADSYNVMRAGGSGGPYTNIATTAVTNWSDTGLSGNTTYYYVVSATNAAGESADSTEASATTYSVPVAGDLEIVRQADAGCKVHIDELLAGCSDPAGRNFGLSSVATLSASNQTITVSAPWIFYSPTDGFTEDDRFSFSITNSVGVSAQGWVIITATNRTTSLAISTGGGDVALILNGIPGNTAVIQATTNLLSGIWTDLETNTFGTTGFFEFSETNAPSPRFYRLNSNP